MSVLFNNRRQIQTEHKNRPNIRRVGEKDKRCSTDDNLLVFGYACHLFANEEKALYFHEGKDLIPWMGDESLMIDRYDGRLLFEDLSQFGLKSSSAEIQLSDQELEVERQCDKERYLALEESVQSDNYEEEMKRFKEAIASESSYSAVGFSYDKYYPQYNYNSVEDSSSTATQYYPYTEQKNVASVHEEPKVEQSSNIQHVQEQEKLEVFVPSEELGVPEDMEVPDTAKLNAIIERTAFFIKDHGPQMEIVVKAKQSGNPQFGFLHFDHCLNPYYKIILKAVRNGTYEPVTSKPVTPPAEDESDEETELHPLLTASLRTPVSTKKPSSSFPNPELPLPPGWTVVATKDNSQKSAEISGDVSLPGIVQDGTNMAMPFHAGYALQLHSQYDVKQQSFASMTLLPPGIPAILYPSNDGVALVAPTMANYAVASVGRPIIPPPPDLKPICDKLAAYVARNGQEFEDNIKAKDDPRFDFLNETSDHYTYYHMKRKECKVNPVSKTSKASGQGEVPKSLVPYAKPVSFQIKAKDTKRPVIEYRSTAVFKSAKADESDEEETGEEHEESQSKDSCENGQTAAASQPDVHGPKTQEDVMAEERTTKLKEEKEKEVQRLEEEAKSTTSSLRRQVQLERRRRAQLFINMLKKSKPTSEAESSSNQNRSDSNNIFEPQAPN